MPLMSVPQRHKGRVGDVAFTVTCAPGPAAAAGTRQIGPGWVVIDVPTISGGAVVLARFCRELAREASRVAADLDPGQAITTGGQS